MGWPRRYDGARNGAKPMIRMVQMLRRAQHLTHEAFSAYWRDVHGPLVAALQVDLDIARYVQLHRDPAGQALDTQASDARGGMEPPFDGIAEYWWKGEEALRIALSRTAGQAACERLVESERNFTHTAASPLWFATEYPQVAKGLRRPVAYFRSGLMRLHFALQPKLGLSDEEARRYWLENHGPLIRSHSPARGLVGYNQVHRRDCALLGSFTSARNVTAEPYLGHAESWFDRPPGLEPPPEMQAAMQAALTDEENFIDWDRSTILVGKEMVFIDREWA